MSYINQTEQAVRAFIDYFNSLSLPDGSNPGTRVLKSASVVTVPAAVKIEDSTASNIANVLPASTAATAASTALVVAISPGTPISLSASASGGATPINYISTASTNATSTKGSAGTLYGIQAGNIDSAARYLKIYDKATAPTVGTDTPVMTVMIPGNTSGAGNNIPITTAGIAFANGIAWALTTGMPVTDTGAVAASEITVNFQYK
jgi:hypothetical protein